MRGETRHAYAITEDARRLRPAGDHLPRRCGTARHYELSGCKWFVTDGDVASYFIVLAWAVDGVDRQPTLFLVDKDAPGVEMTADPDFTHNFPYRHPEFTFTQTPVPAANVLGGLGRGFELTGEWFIEERVHIAARCVGACTRLIELGTEPGRSSASSSARASSTTRRSRSRWPTAPPRPPPPVCSPTTSAGCTTPAPTASSSTPRPRWPS